MPRPADFTATIDNTYFPLQAGTRFLYRGTQEGKAREVSVFVTHKIKMILGIRATVILDQVLVDGKPKEKPFDWVRAGQARQRLVPRRGLLGLRQRQVGSQRRLVGDWRARCEARHRDGSRPVLR